MTRYLITMVKTQDFGKFMMGNPVSDMTVEVQATTLRLAIEKAETEYPMWVAIDHERVRKEL